MNATLPRVENGATARAGRPSWFVAAAGKRSGLYSWPRLVTMASCGEIPADAILLKEGSTRWVRAATLQTFFGPRAGPTSVVEPDASSDKHKAAVARDHGAATQHPEDPVAPDAREPQAPSVEVTVPTLASLADELFLDWAAPPSHEKQETQGDEQEEQPPGLERNECATETADPTDEPQREEEEGGDATADDEGVADPVRHHGFWSGTTVLAAALFLLIAGSVILGFFTAGILDLGLGSPTSETVLPKKYRSPDPARPQPGGGRPAYFFTGAP